MDRRFSFGWTQLFFLLVFSICASLFFSFQSGYRMEMNKTRMIENFLSEHHDLGMGTLAVQIDMPQVKIADEVYNSLTVLTDEGKYIFVYRETAGQNTVEAVQEVQPDYQWVYKSLPVTPSVAWLFQTQEEAGIPTEMPDANTVKSDKGTFTVTYLQETATRLYKGTELIGTQSIPWTIPERTLRYLQEKEETTGEISSVVYTQWEEDKQCFYFTTDKGNYRLDAYYNGSAELLQAEAE